jgi:hypothetical protein
MMKKTLLLPLLPVFLYAAGCHHAAPAVARLEVEPRSLTLPYPQLVPLRLTWTPVATNGETPSEPLVFLHLLDAKGAVLRTWDHPFPQHWAAGTPATYEVNLYQSALAPPLDPGRYRLSVGLYDRGGQRFLLDGLGEPIARQEYQATEVTVPAQAPAPQLTFSPAWLPLEAGSDKQILARRRLGDQPGEIRLDGIPGPGTVWLSFRIPPGNRPNEQLVFHDAGTNSPAAVVRCSCGSVETGITGPGAHEVEMPVDAAAAGAGCRVTLTPNFHILTAGQPQPWSVALQAVAWIPSGASPASGSPAATGPKPAGGTE